MKWRAERRQTLRKLRQRVCLFYLYNFFKIHGSTRRKRAQKLTTKSLFIWAVADCIENALQTKLFSKLVILAGVGRRNHFFKSDFCPTPYFILNLFSYGGSSWLHWKCASNQAFSKLVILAGVGRRNHFFKSDFCPTPIFNGCNIGVAIA